jgi:hypothetical protein
MNPLANPYAPGHTLAAPSPLRLLQGQYELYLFHGRKSKKLSNRARAANSGELESGACQRID